MSMIDFSAVGATTPSLVEMKKLTTPPQLYDHFEMYHIPGVDDIWKRIVVRHPQQNSCDKDDKDEVQCQDRGSRRSRDSHTMDVDDSDDDSDNDSVSTQSDDDNVGSDRRCLSCSCFLDFLQIHPQIASSIQILDYIGPYANKNQGPLLTEMPTIGRPVRKCDAEVLFGILKHLPNLRKLHLEYIVFHPRAKPSETHDMIQLDFVKITLPYCEDPKLANELALLELLRLFKDIGTLELDCYTGPYFEDWGAMPMPERLRFSELRLHEFHDIYAVVSVMRYTKIMNKLRSLTINAVLNSSEGQATALVEMLGAVSDKLEYFRCGIERIFDDDKESYEEAPVPFTEIMKGAQWSSLRELDIRVSVTKTSECDRYWSELCAMFMATNIPNLERITLGVSSDGGKNSTNKLYCAPTSWGLRHLSDSLQRFPRLEDIVFTGDLSSSFRTVIETGMGNLKMLRLLSFREDVPRGSNVLRFVEE